MIKEKTFSISRARDFKGSRAWESLCIANMQGITVSLHWTDQPYHWHVNDGEEVFVVLDGRVEMHIRDETSQEHVYILEVGDIFHGNSQCEHIAHPQVPSRILVIEKEGSV